MWLAELVVTAVRLEGRTKAEVACDYGRVAALGLRAVPALRP